MKWSFCTVGPPDQGAVRVRKHAGRQAASSPLADRPRHLPQGRRSGIDPHQGARSGEGKGLRRSKRRSQEGAVMATFTVTGTQDRGAGSLRAAVLAANAATGDDDIVFSSAFNGGVDDLIRLTSGQIEITDGLTITGGPAGVAITGDANGDDIVGAGAITDVAASLDGEDRLDDNSRIFDATADLTIDGLTLTGGGSGAAGAGDLTVTNSTVSGNRGSALSGGYVTLINSTVTGSVIENGHGGAAISVSFVATLINSTITGNSDTGPDYGNSVITYASYDNGWVNLTNSIVLGNAGGIGDRIRAASFGGGNIMGTTLFDGTDTRDVTAAEVFSHTVEIAPGVFAGVLADNGGPTQTIAIRADGPAAGAADLANATATDQRGFARDAAPDLGAFEAGAEDGLKLVGGPRADRLVGGSGDDRIYGKGGDDLLCGLAGDDLLRGGKGRDILKGGDGDDVVFGDKGDDRIGGGAGDDLLYGGRGHDVFVFAPDLGADTIVGFDANPWRGQDRMDLRALGISAASFASEVTIEQIDDDTLITLQGQGSVLCRGIEGEGAAHIDQSDFLLLA
jgi:Ca2+-binding RTX toxin-like protein